MAPQLSGAELGVFYYAGHGIQVDDDNYLIGVNAPADLAGRRGLVRAADITRRFQAAARSTLVFLDACRNNPFATDANAGLAVADARIIPVVPPEQFDKSLTTQPTGLMITYATSPNSVAFDGTGKHSPFTQAFLDVVGTPGYSIQQSISEIWPVGRRSDEFRADAMVAIVADELSVSQRKRDPRAGDRDLPRPRDGGEWLFQRGAP